MASITVKNTSGKDAGSIDLDEDMFGVQPNVPLMHQFITAQLAARRSGTQSTKTRAEVRGGGRKPFKQKGTGNARQGSSRSPHMSGGGVAHGLDEVGARLGEARTADGEAAAAPLHEQYALAAALRAGVVGVLEGRAEGLDPGRLRLAATAAHLLQCRADPFGVGRCQPEADP